MKIIVFWSLIWSINGKQAQPLCYVEVIMFTDFVYCACAVTSHHFITCTYFIGPCIRSNVQYYIDFVRPYGISTLVIQIYLYLFRWREIFECLNDFKTQAGPFAKKCNFGPSGWESNPRPCQSSAMLYWLSYRGRCWEHGHEFSIYYGGTADEMKSLFNGILWHLHSTANI